MDASRAKMRRLFVWGMTLGSGVAIAGAMAMLLHLFLPFWLCLTVFILGSLFWLRTGWKFAKNNDHLARRPEQ
jgi:hypothetical protein